MLGMELALALMIVVGILAAALLVVKLIKGERK